MIRIARGLGWTLVVSGAVVLLYVVYLLWFTDLSANASQRELAEAWESPQAEPGDVDDAGDGVSVGGGFEVPEQGVTTLPGDGDGEGEAEPVDTGEAFLAMWFERDGQRVVADDVLYVVGDVTLDHLRLGPGHYPQSAAPGDPGNLAIAGHRTTYGRPFWALDELAEGDTIHVVDRSGQEWVYAYREQRVVAPTDIWVIGDGAWGTEAPTITLTTCHPRFSAAQRLIAWGELVEEPLAS
ncbi:class E sortase [Egicoccus sp. AB-alg6-2]|uniref:class E sortase n=1 Tax=Egicoccus sp. AB-alg6-2 TaxID=3242692 RepID=UPI00359EA27C